MKLIAFILCIVCSSLAASAQGFGVKAISDTIVVSSDTFRCRSYTYVCFVAEGNEGEYALITWLTPGSGTQPVLAGSYLCPPVAGKSLGDVRVRLNSLTSYVTATGDTLNPRVICYAWK